MGSFVNLSCAVLENSESTDWCACIEEWSVVYCEEDEDAESTCVCGNEGLRYLYTVRNVLNGKELFPIGSECIKRFGNSEMEDEARCWAQAYRLVNLATEYGKTRQLSIVHDKKMFSRKLLAFMYRNGAFRRTKWNEYDSGNDYRFMLDMFNAQTLSPRQQVKADHVMHDSIYPWLRKLYKQRNERKAK
jgi:hypothetical protein